LKFLTLLKQKLSSQIIKLIISLCLLYFAFSRVDFQSLVTTFSKTALWLVCIGYLSDQILVLAHVFRWQFILKKLHITTSFRTLLKVNYIGHFFNFFMPTTMGGDVMRYWEISSTTSKKTEIVSSIILERYMGVFSLIFISMLISYTHLTHLAPVFHKYLYFVTAIFVLMCVFMFIKPPEKAWEKLFKYKHIKGVAQKLINVWQSFSVISKSRALFIQTFLLSGIIQGGGILIIYLFSLALGMTVPFPIFILFMSLIILMSLVPVSVCGMGVRETGFLYFFSQLGVDDTLILSLSILTFSRLLILGFIGGGIYTLKNMKKTAK
jgi:glycosyltransferase 2 family protein